jgi:hypothetical protein
MKTSAFVWMSLVSLLTGTEPREAVVEAASPPAVSVKEVEVKKESALDREIEEFRAKHEARNAVMINNAGGRALDKEGRITGSEELGSPVAPGEIITISEAMVNDSVVELYTSIKKLPEHAHTVRILYSESPDGKSSSLLGYTIENADDVYTKLVRYDGRTPWLEWITESFKKDDAEHEAAGEKPD